MTFNENETEHLQLIQSIINRMASNGFLLKGWCITLLTALIALGIDKHPKILVVSILPILGFWYLDAFFLKTERAYRSLYNKAILKDETVPLFSLNPMYSGEQHTIWQSFFSQTLSVFYGGLLILVMIVYFMTSRT